MNTFTIERPMKYISPSSFQAWENCEYYTYLDKCTNLKATDYIQSPNAMFGTVFDVLVKSGLCSTYGWSLDKNKIWEIGLTTTLAQCLTDGVKHANNYLTHKHIWSNHEWVGVDFQAEGNICGVPIFGYPDGETGDGAFDWKTRGYLASYTTSPKPGYTVAYDLRTGDVYKGRHKKAGEPFDKINRPWAIQMLFYKWMLKGDNDSSFGGTIHEICIQPNRDICAEHCVSFSDEFIDEIKGKLVQMWDMYGGTTVELNVPICSDAKCQKYNSLCSMAEHCGYFKEYLKNQ